MNNLLELVSTLSKNVGKELPKNLKEINERNLNNIKEKGFITAAEGLAIETRSIINFSNIPTNTTNDIVDKYSGSVLLKKATLYENLNAETKAPYITQDSANWALEGASVDFSAVLNSKRLKPYRLTAKVSISNMVINQCNTMNEQFKNILSRAIEDKLIETILSNGAESTTTPKGLFNGITPVSLTTIDSVIDMLADVDKAHTNNTLLISPTAKAKLLKVSKNYSLLDNPTLFGAEFSVEPKMKDDYLVYLDLSKLVIASFGISSIVVDPFTDSINGNTIITINSYFDYDFVGTTDFIKVGKF